MSSGEAIDILALDAADAKNLSAITERYNRLHDINDPKNGGSFYLQSKVYRAHEALLEDMKPPKEGPDAGAPKDGPPSS